MIEGCTPCPPELAERYRQSGHWLDQTLGEMLEAGIARWPERNAVIAGDVRLTYRELGERIESLAAHLYRAGLRPRERVVLQLANGPEFLPVFFALLRIGVIPVLALRGHRQMEIGHFIRHAAAVAYFIPATIRDFDYRIMADELRRECPTLHHVFVAGPPGPGQTGLPELIGRPLSPTARERILDELRPDPADVALLLLSGGTTGLPKMIPRTHNDYLCNCRFTGGHAGFDEATVFLAFLPLAHHYTLASPGVLGVLARGGRIVVAPDTDPENLLRLIEAESVTHVAAGVPLVSAWLNSDLPERYDLSSLKVVFNGGARLLPEMRRRLRERFRCIYQENYGSGEGVIHQTRLDDPDDIVLESSGKPACPGDEIKVIDEQDRELPDGEAGELCVRGPTTIRGYYKAPEVDAQAFTADGFFRTGDVVVKRRGYVYVVGRRKDLINRGGEKISAEEVENLALRHPKVHRVCIVAMPDDKYGERACAYVVPAPGMALSLRELNEFLLAQRIAKFKLPERLELVEDFPLSAAGKILRRSLREMIAEKVAAEKAGARALAS